MTLRRDVSCLPDKHGAYKQSPTLPPSPSSTHYPHSTFPTPTKQGIPSTPPYLVHSPLTPLQLFNKMKFTTLTLCALSFIGLSSSQAVGTTTLLTSVTCFNPKYCASMTALNTNAITPSASLATPSTGSNGYGYPIATYTTCNTDGATSCITSVDCGNMNSTAVWWPSSTTLCTTASAQKPVCSATSMGSYSCMPIERASTTSNKGGRSQRWVARLAKATATAKEFGDRAKKLKVGQTGSYAIPSSSTSLPPATITTTVESWTHSWVPAPSHCYSCMRPSSDSSRDGFTETRLTLEGETTLAVVE